MIPGTTILLISLATVPAISTPIALWWKSRSWRSVTRAEEDLGDRIIESVDSLDDFYTELVNELSSAKLEPGENPIDEEPPKRKIISALPSTEGGVVNTRTRFKLVKRDNRQLLEQAIEHFGHRDVTVVRGHREDVPHAFKPIHVNNHMRLAKKLSDLCKVHIVIRGYSEANDLVVEQFLKNKLRQIPNLRVDHALKVVALAKIMVFTPTVHDVEASALMNTRALMKRRFEMDQTKHSREGGLFGWFTGYKRVDGPSRST